MPTTAATYKKRLWVGCSGWNYAHWREVVYPNGLPARRWLEHYAKLFHTVEVNNTFYRLPSVSAVEGWALQTPPDFVFSVKASRYLTHMKRLTDMGTGVARFYERIEPLRRRGSSDRSYGSCRRTSTVTTTGWEVRSRSCRRVATASSFATRAGSRTTCTRSFARTVSPS